MKRTIRIALVLIIALSAVAAFGQVSGVDNFEEYAQIAANGAFQPARLAGYPGGPGIISGGEPYINGGLFGNNNTVFASAGAFFDLSGRIQIICENCFPQILIDSGKSGPFLHLAFDLLEPQDPHFKGVVFNYKIYDYSHPNNFKTVSLAPGTFQHVTWDTPVSILAIESPEIDDAFFFFAIDNLHYTIPPPRLLSTGAGVTPPDPVPFDQELYIDNDDPVDVTYPVGLPFFMRMKVMRPDYDWDNDTKTTFQIQEIEPVTFPLDLTTQAFGSNHLWSYGDLNPDIYKSFQSVHTGNAYITAQPQSKFTTITVAKLAINMHIVAPKNLDNDGQCGVSTAFDARFIDLGDKAGIPPQYLKALAMNQNPQRPGFFDNTYWRYLPYLVDIGMLQQAAQTSIFARPYSDYALSESNLPEGNDLCPSAPVTVRFPPHDCRFDSPFDDVKPRYSTGLRFVDNDGVKRFLSRADDALAPVTIKQIVDANTFLDAPNPTPQSGPTKAIGATQSGHRRASKPPGDPLRVSAQTPLASRYGLFGVIPPQAIVSQHWSGILTGVGRRYNPSLLFDFESPDDNNPILPGSGSFIAGTSTLTDYYKQVRHDDIRFKNEGEFTTSLKEMFSMYEAESKGLADAVIETAPRCLPGPGKPIFKPPVPNDNGGGSCAAPVIRAQSTNLTTSGDPLVISVGIAGDSRVTHYQWYQGASGDTTHPIANGLAGFLKVSPSSSTSYWVAVSNRCGTTASETISVSVAPPCPGVIITTNPANVTIAPGEQTTLHVAATNATSYHWFRGDGPATAGVDGDRSNPISGVNGPDLSVQPSSTTNYWVEATNGCLRALSSTATVTVTSPTCDSPAITAQPQGTTINSGQSATLSVAATGTAPLTIQWTTSEGVAVGTGSSIAVTPSATTSYVAHITNACGAIDSASATVTINQLPQCQPASIVTQPQDMTATAGHSVTLTVAVGGTAPVSVQWSTADGTPLATGTSLTVSPSQSTSYYATVSNACGSVRSRTASVTVVAACTPITITQQPNAEQTIVVGQQAGFLSVLVIGTSPHFQWYQHDRITGDNSPIPGANASIYFALQPGDYVCRITNDCSSVDTIIASVLSGVVCAPGGAFSVTPDQTVTAGDSITLDVTPSGSSPYTFAWYQILPDGTSSQIGVTKQLTVTPTAEVTQYYVIVSSPCGSGGSQPITITLCHPALITQQPVAPPPFTDFGQSATLSVAATGTNLHYAWFANFVQLPADAPSITIFAPNSPTDYYCTVSSDCGTADSNHIVVKPPCIAPRITTQPASQSVSAGNSATLSLAASGNTPMTVSWFASDGTPVGTGNPISVSPSVTTSYYATVSNSCGSANSDTVTVSVVASCIAPSVTSQPQNVTIVQGTSTTLHVAASGDAPLQYQWFTSNDVAVPSGTNASVTVAPLQTQTYYVTVSNGCGSVRSNFVTVTVNCIAPHITSEPPSSVTITRGQIVTLSVTATGSLLHYQWFEQFPNETSPHSVVNGSETASLTVGGNDTPTGTIYTCKVFNGCGSVTSDPTVLNIQ